MAAVAADFATSIWIVAIVLTTVGLGSAGLGSQEKLGWGA